jgi:hypothetical protein
MDSGPPTRSFTPLACSLLVVSFAVCGAGALARDPDPAVAVAEQRVVVPATGPVCQHASGDECQVLVNSWPVDGLVPPGRAAPSGATAGSVDADPSSALQIGLRLQRDLFTRGGRLAPIDVLMADEAMTPATERTGRAPDWAAQLRAARIEMKKERG